MKAAVAFCILVGLVYITSTKTISSGLAPDTVKNQHNTAKASLETSGNNETKGDLGGNGLKSKDEAEPRVTYIEVPKDSKNYEPNSNKNYKMFQQNNPYIAQALIRPQMSNLNHISSDVHPYESIPDDRHPIYLEFLRNNPDFIPPSPAPLTRRYMQHNQLRLLPPASIPSEVYPYQPILNKLSPFYVELLKNNPDFIPPPTAGIPVSYLQGYQAPPNYMQYQPMNPVLLSPPIHNPEDIQLNYPIPLNQETQTPTHGTNWKSPEQLKEMGEKFKNGSLNIKDYTAIPAYKEWNGPATESNANPPADSPSNDVRTFDNPKNSDKGNGKRSQKCFPNGRKCVAQFRNQ